MKETERLYLKEYDEKYIEKYHSNFFSEKETAKYTLWRPTNNKFDAKDKLEYWINEVKVSVLWLVHQKSDDEPVGFISVDEIEENVYGNLGIAIGTKYLKRGYASEVLKTLIEYIKDNGGKAIHYSHFKENEASKNLALKFGFKYYKMDKRIRRYDNKEFDELFYILNL